MTDSVPNGTKSVASCGISGCDRPHKARGLCATHYARWRRTGDPEKVRRAGRPPEPFAQTMRSLGYDSSERTLRRQTRAMQLLGEFGDTRAAITEAMRPCGGLNVSKLERLADAAVMTYVCTTMADE